MLQIFSWATAGLAEAGSQKTGIRQAISAIWQGIGLKIEAKT